MMNNTNMSDKEIAAWQGLYEGAQIQIANIQKTINEKDALIAELVALLDKAQYCVVIASDYRYDLAGSDDLKCQEYNELNVTIYNKLNELAKASSPVSEKAK